MSDLRKLAEAATPGPWVTTERAWPEQVGCCPLVGRPYSIHRSDNNNVAAASTLEDAAFIAAASPTAVLALLDRIEELEAANRACEDAVAEWGAKAGALQAEVDKLMGECQEMFRKYDDAREAVFILDGAMEEMESVSPNYVDGTPMNRPKMREVLTHLSWKATSARTDPVVRRIVEGG